MAGDEIQVMPTRETAYAIWIHGTGWLKAMNPKTNANEPFATVERPVAESVLTLYGDGAVIREFDGSMIMLEELFLLRERERDEAARAKQTEVAERLAQSPAWLRFILRLVQRRQG